MFCAQCGTKFEEGDVRCGRCGWEPTQKPEVIQAPVIPEAEPQKVEAPIAQPVVSNPVVQPVNTPVAQPVYGTQPVMQNVYDNAPVMQNVYDTAPVMQNVYDNAPVMQNADNSPVMQNTMNYQAPPAQPKKKKGLMIAIIVAAVLVVGAIAAAIGVSVYHNSDTYKVKQAAEYLEEGNIYSAKEILTGVYSTEADALNKFISVESAKQNFDTAVTVSYATTYNPSDAADEFESFAAVVSDIDADLVIMVYLPENLQSRLDEYKAAVEFIESTVYGKETDGITLYEDRGFYHFFRDAQKVMLNEVDRNNSSFGGASFTLNGLQANVNIANDALEDLGGYDFDAIELSSDEVTKFPEQWSGKTIGISTHAKGVIRDLIDVCESTAESNQEIIDEGLKKFGEYENLYITDADPSYSADVGDYLQNIKSESDVTANAERIAAMLQVEMLYSILNGEAATIL